MFLEVFNDTKGSTFRFLGYLELIKNLKPLEFFGHCQTLFFFNLTEQLFYSQYFIIVCIRFKCFQVRFQPFTLSLKVTLVFLKPSIFIVNKAACESPGPHSFSAP